MGVVFHTLMGQSLWGLSFTQNPTHLRNDIVSWEVSVCSMSGIEACMSEPVSRWRHCSVEAVNQHP